MNQTALHLPRRAEKPRSTGLTMVIDGGIPLWCFTDLVSSAAEYIDVVKFGWGTAVVSTDLRAKIKVLSTKDIGFYFGGTLFEKYVLQGRFDDFRRFCQLRSPARRGIERHDPDVQHGPGLLAMARTWLPAIGWNRELAGHGRAAALRAVQGEDAAQCFDTVRQPGQS